MEKVASPQRKKGFALIIALVLMAFVVLLSLCLTTLVNVEVRTAGMNSSRQEARENARLGMLVALGQLQALAGPDQRVTSNAGVLNSEIDSFDVLEANKSHWTGVWKVNYDASTGRHSAELLNFLISGLSDEAVNPLAEAQGYTVPDNADSDPNFVELLGSGTINEANKNDFIIARKVDVGDKGRYAYWVGDEGVKARINLDEKDQNVSLSAPEGRIKMATSSQSPAAVMTGFESLFDNTQMKRLNSIEEMPMISTDLTQQKISDRYFDFTLHSVGIPTNTAEGGLKKDLSLAFEMSNEDYNKDAFFAGDLENGFPDSQYPHLNHKFRYVFNEPLDYATPDKTVRGPTWHVLRNYYRQYKQVVNVRTQPAIQAQVDMPLARRPNGKYDEKLSVPSVYNLFVDKEFEPLIEDGFTGDDTIIRPTEGAISPVVTRLQHAFSFRKVALTEEQKQSLPPDGSLSNHEYQLQIIWDPVVTLWNPYNVSLELNGVIVEVGRLPFKLNITTTEDAYIYYDDKNQNGVRTKSTAHPNGAALPPVHAEGGTAQKREHYGLIFEKIVVHDWNKLDDWGETPYSIRFIIGNKDQSMTLAPGEVIVYSPASFYERSDSVVYAEPGFDADAGFAFDTGITGTNAQKVSIFINEKVNEYFNSTEVHLINDWKRVDEDMRYVAPDDQTLPLLNYLNAYRPQLDEDTRYPKGNNWDSFNFGSLPSGAGKFYLFQCDLFMKTSDVAKNAVALAPYNNPRSRSTRPIGLENAKSKPADPLWDLVFDEAGIESVGNAGPDNRGFWGESNLGGTSFVTLFEVPTAPLTSLGQFMHANIALRGHYPMYPVGSSFASPFIPLDQYIAGIEHNDHHKAYVPDISYLMNKALWDGYFFSSLTPQSTDIFDTDTDRSIVEVAEGFAERGELLPNTRIMFLGNSSGNLSFAGFLNRIIDYNKIADNSHAVSAAFLGTKGAFNVNSTSVEAWKSVLSGLRNEVVAYFDPETKSFSRVNIKEATPYSKFTLPNGGNTEAWRGFSELTDDQITNLAEAIVANVHERGPFPTLASFVNRELVDGETGLAGVLEASIQQTAINDSHYTFTADTGLLHEPENINRYDGDSPLARETGIPGFLTQADLLLAIGSVITNRSDTFVIRSYGEALNPLTKEPVAEAWLEVVVQRIGMPVEPTSNDPDDPDFFTPKVDAQGNDLGRAFQIVSMRWLNEEEI